MDQYTYLNFISGNSKNHVNKFDNDYWGTIYKTIDKKYDI